MKKLMSAALLTSAVIWSVASAAQNYSVMAGNWAGSVTTNLKDTSGGGKPMAEETGTPVTITFSKVNNGLAGESLVGATKEKWAIQGDNYTWDDGEITVTSTAVTFDKLPEWVKKESGVTPTDTYFAFKYLTCTVNATKKPCEIGKHLPDGIDKSGIWVFAVKGNKLQSNVYYTYSNGGKRILEQSLSAKK